MFTQPLRDGSRIDISMMDRKSLFFRCLRWALACQMELKIGEERPFASFDQAFFEEICQASQVPHGKLRTSFLFTILKNFRVMRFLCRLLIVVVWARLHSILHDAFIDEPEACSRLDEIMQDVISYEASLLGKSLVEMPRAQLSLAQWLLNPFFKTAFSLRPEFKYLLNTETLIAHARGFHYEGFKPSCMRRMWIPRPFLLKGRESLRDQATKVA